MHVESYPQINMNIYFAQIMNMQKAHFYFFVNIVELFTVILF